MVGTMIPGITGVTISPAMLCYSSVMPSKVEVFTECIRGRILNCMTGTPGAGMKSIFCRYVVYVFHANTHRTYRTVRYPTQKTTNTLTSRTTQLLEA